MQCTKYICIHWENFKDEALRSYSKISKLEKSHDFSGTFFLVGSFYFADGVLSNVIRLDVFCLLTPVLYKNVVHLVIYIKYYSIEISVNIYVVIYTRDKIK